MRCFARVVQCSFELQQRLRFNHVRAEAGGVCGKIHRQEFALQLSAWLFAIAEAGGKPLRPGCPRQTADATMSIVVY